MDRILNSRFFVAFILSALAGVLLYFSFPFPAKDRYLALIRVKNPGVYASFLGFYHLFLFTTPMIVFSGLLSALYVFAYNPKRDDAEGALPPYPYPARRESLFVVVGELHHPTRAEASARPRWLTIPERGLFTGTAVFGAIGTGKTSCCIRPFARQLFGYRPLDPDRKLGGLVLEVKGDLCRSIHEDLKALGRGDDYLEISIDPGTYRTLYGDSPYCYNPLYNELDAYALAYALASLITLSFGKSKEPFWQMASTNLVKFVILLYRLVDGYVTLRDVYLSAVNPKRLEEKLTQGEALFQGLDSVVVSADTYADPQYYPRLERFGFVLDETTSTLGAPSTKDLGQALERHKIPHEVRRDAPTGAHDARAREQFEAVETWYRHDWMAIDTKLRTSIVEGVSVFLSLFDDNPDVRRVFCPPKECYDPVVNRPDATGRYPYGRPLPHFAQLLEQGKVVALNFPVSANPGLARALGTLMKMDFQRALLLRIPKMTAEPNRHYRQVAFICDEYQNFATAGEENPNGDEKFFALSRQPRCIPIVATQSVSSLKSSLPGDSYRTLMQCFRTKVFLSLADEFSTKVAAELCGKEDKPYVSFNLSESNHDAKVSLLTGKTVSNKGSVSASKSYSHRKEERFSQKTFAELKNAQAVVIPYDGTNPGEATLCYLKPYYLDPNVTWFEQSRRGLL